MKLLLLSDRESEYLWDYYQPGRLKDIDVIVTDKKPPVELMKEFRAADIEVVY